jgi:PAS domain S-box-containing protein
VPHIDRRPTPKYDGRGLWSGSSSCDGDGHERTRMGHELSRLVDTLPGLVWTALADGHVDFVNQGWCEYTGLSRDEVRGLGWQRVIHSEDLPQLLERWRSIQDSGKPGDMEARLRRFDGEYRWFLIRTSPVADASGRTDRHVVRREHRYR